jgi:hypothetical protein
MVSGWGKWWSRQVRVNVSIGTLALGIAGCGGSVTETPVDVPDDCVGSYEGSFAGDIRGSLTGRLGSDARFSVTFVQSGNGQTASGSGDVEEDGSIEVVLGPNHVIGSFNFGRCRASGDWVAGDAAGSWTASRK